MRLDPERRQVLRVHSCLAGSHAQAALKDADMVLAVGGQPVSSYNDVERIIAAAAAAAEPAAAPQQAGARPPAKRQRAEDGGEGGTAADALPQVALTIFREGQVQEVAVRWVRGMGKQRSAS